MYYATTGLVLDIALNLRRRQQHAQRLLSEILSELGVEAAIWLEDDSRVVIQLDGHARSGLAIPHHRERDAEGIPEEVVDETVEETERRVWALVDGLLFSGA